MSNCLERWRVNYPLNFLVRRKIISHHQSRQIIVHKEQFVFQVKNCLTWRRHTDERSKTTSHFWPFRKWKKSWPAKREKWRDFQTSLIGDRREVTLCQLFICPSLKALNPQQLCTINICWKLSSTPETICMFLQSTQAKGPLYSFTGHPLRPVAPTKVLALLKKFSNIPSPRKNLCGQQWTSTESLSLMPAVDFGAQKMPLDQMFLSSWVTFRIHSQQQLMKTSIFGF